MRLSGQFRVCLLVLFFLQKYFERKKTLTSKQPTKQKITLQKATKAAFFCAHKLRRGWKLLDLHFVHFVRVESFCKKKTKKQKTKKKQKKKQTWNWPDSLNSLYYWCLPLSTRLWNLYLQALIYICNHLWEFLLFMTVLFNESLFICDHLWESLLFMRIFISLSYFWKSLFL